MDNAQKAIMIGVGLFITIIVIAAVMLITGMGQDMLTSGQQEVSNISSSLQAQVTADYDGTTVNGAQVISAIKRFYKDERMVLKVINAAGATANEYGPVTCTLDTNNETTAVSDVGSALKTIGTLSDRTDSSTYIPNSAKYTANLIKIKGSDDVVGIIFTRQ